MSTVKKIEFQVGIGLDMFSMDYVTHIVQIKDTPFPVVAMKKHHTLLKHYGKSSFPKVALSFINKNTRHRKERKDERE